MLQINTSTILYIMSSIILDNLDNQYLNCRSCRIQLILINLICDRYIIKIFNIAQDGFDGRQIN